MKTPYLWVKEKTESKLYYIDDISIKKETEGYWNNMGWVLPEKIEEKIELKLLYKKDGEIIEKTKTIALANHIESKASSAEQLLAAEKMRVPTLMDLMEVEFEDGIPVCAKLPSKEEREALALEVVAFLKKWGLWRDTSIFTNGYRYKFTEEISDEYKGFWNLKFEKNVDPDEYTTGSAWYGYPDEPHMVKRNYSNPEHIFDMTFEGHLYSLLNDHEYEVYAEDIGLEGWNYIFENTSLIEERLEEDYGATNLDEYYENIKAMSFAEYSEKDREECMYSGWDPLVFDTWQDYLDMGGDEGAGLRPLYELYDTYAQYLECEEAFENIDKESLKPVWDKMVMDAEEIYMNENRLISIPELSNHIWNEFQEIFEKHNLRFELGFPWSLSCYKDN